MTSLNDEARKSVQDAVDALRQWRSEIDAVNERGLTLAMDRMTAAQQALGWPNRVTADTGPSAVQPGKMHYFMVLDAVRAQLLKSSKEDMRVIDKVAEACYASLLPQTSFSPKPSLAPLICSGDAARTEITKRSKLPIFAVALVALGVIGYAIYDRSVQPTNTAVNNDKYVDGAAPNQRSAEPSVPSEPSISPIPHPPATAPQLEEKASTPQALIIPEPAAHSGVSKIIVELGTFATQQQAARKSDELQKRAIDTFVGRAPVVAKVKRTKGTVWLLEIRDFVERSDAVNFCARLHSKGFKCDIRVTE